MPAIRKSSLNMAALFAATLAAQALALDPATLAVNRWHKAPLRWKLPADEPGGAFQVRGWGSMQYNAGNKSLVFYEGFGPSSRGRFCIYGNALYEYSVATDTLALRALGNWVCEVGQLPSPLPANDTFPTPKDRHTYSQFAYSPTNHTLYLAHGASGSNNHPHDLWAYAFSDRRWRHLGTAPGATAAWECACDGSLLHDPLKDELIYIQSRKEVHAYSIASGTWRKVTTQGALTGAVGAKAAYDSKRGRFAFFGNVWTENNVGTRDLVFFEPATGAWTHVEPAGHWPPARSYATMAYHPTLDIYFLHGGWRQRDTWIFDPAKSAWTQPVIEDTVGAGGRSANVAYDPSSDLLVAFEGGVMHLLRYRPGGDTKAGTPAQRGPSARGPRAVFRRGGTGRALRVVFDGVFPSGVGLGADGRRLPD